jgi:hypothetical protein
MNLTARIIVLVAPAILVFTLLRQVRHRRIRARYALAWLGAITVMVPFAVLPSLTDRTAEFLGIAYAPALFLVAGFVFLAVLAIHEASVITRLEERTRILAEEMAQLRLAVQPTASAEQDTQNNLRSGPQERL